MLGVCDSEKRGWSNVVNVLNPKSVTRNELYGYIHPMPDYI